MKYISYSYVESGRRSGHILKDLFTTVIIAEIFNLKVIYNLDWKRQQLLLDLPIDSKKYGQKVVDIYLEENKWDGISLDDFRLLREEIESADDETCFVCRGTYRIHLDQLHRWELDGFVPSGITSRCLSRLQNLYWSNYTRIKDFMTIAIHVRRGDVADSKHYEYDSMGPGRWSFDYYRELINLLNLKFPKHSITVFSEKLNSEDLLKLPNCCIELGDDSHINYHFSKMIRAEYFFPASSSISTWASYLSLGSVLVPGKKIKHWNHPALLPNWISI